MSPLNEKEDGTFIGKINNRSLIINNNDYLLDNPITIAYLPDLKLDIN